MECYEMLSYTSIIPVCFSVLYNINNFLISIIDFNSPLIFLQIISYIILRNVSGVLRTCFSSLFAWFGKISLELMVCQCHIWLAADTHGVLVLLPGYPVLNGLIVSFIFICICHEVNNSQ